MIKISKYFWIFLSIFGFLTVLIFSVGRKYLPFLLHKTVYLCKHIIETVPLQPLRSNFKFIIAFILIVLFIFIVIRLIATFFAIFKQKKELVKKIVSSEKIDSIALKLKLKNKILVISDHRLLAFCFGLFNSKIYVSTEMVKQLSQNELEIVLRHEMYHLLNKDTLVMTFARLGELLFPFLPIISDLLAKYSMQREIQADLFAHSNSKNGKNDLISVLTKMLKQEPTSVYLLASNLGEYETLELRINLLLEKDLSYPKFSSAKLLISVFFLFILGILFITPVRAVEYHGHGQDAVMACIDPFGSCGNTCELNTLLLNSVQNSSQQNSSTLFSSSIY